MWGERGGRACYSGEEGKNVKRKRSHTTLVGAKRFVSPAARAGISATGIGIAPNLAQHARDRAKPEGVSAQFDEGDAEQLPYADGSFDVVVSLIGAMFAPRPEKVAAELARVCRPGGRLYMANWTPSGMVGQMFKKGWKKSFQHTTWLRMARQN